jgi:cytochrome c
MLKNLATIFSLTLATVFGTAAFAADNGTADEAKAMVDAAVAYYQDNGLDALTTAAQDPANATFHDRDLYVFVYTMEGINTIHGVKPQLNGKDLSGLKDQNGVEIIKGMIQLVQTDGSGWLDYQWPNPTTNTVQAKSSYVTKLDDDHFVGVGIYVQ